MSRSRNRRRVRVATLLLLGLASSGLSACAADPGDDATESVAADSSETPTADQPSATPRHRTASKPSRTRTQRRATQAQGSGAGTDVRRRTRELDRAVRELAARAAVPVPAMRAYARAAWSAPTSCHLNWPTLAAIGRVESDHGRYDGARLRADGTPSAPIIGPTLDGAGDVAAIPATSLGTRLHGDPRWEHALGPMQFLPDTWARWRADGDGDGRLDPQDLDDAAMTTAHYLCADGRDLLAPGVWKAAILAYNHSEKYSLLVFAAADHYNALA